MALIYRGSKVTPGNNRDGAVALNAGIYRGVKHNGSKVEKSSQLSSGSYRGVNWGQKLFKLDTKGAEAPFFIDYSLAEACNRVRPLRFDFII